MGSTRIVEIRNLYKSYRRGTQILPVLKDISLDIEQGEFLAQWAHRGPARPPC